MTTEQCFPPHKDFKTGNACVLLKRCGILYPRMQSLNSPKNGCAKLNDAPRAWIPDALLAFPGQTFKLQPLPGSHDVNLGRIIGLAGLTTIGTQNAVRKKSRHEVISLCWLYSSPPYPP